MGSWVSEIIKGKKVGADLVKIGAAVIGVSTAVGSALTSIAPGAAHLFIGVADGLGAILAGFGVHNFMDANAQGTQATVAAAAQASADPVKPPASGG